MKINKPQFFLAALGMTALVLPATNALSKPGAQKSPIISVYYASPTGKGAACSFAAPCSLMGVRDKVREVSAKMRADIKIVLRGGNYYLTTPLTLTERDSGKNGHKIVWKNYKGETVAIVGGTPVTGWTLDAGNVYKAKVGTGTTFHALYENGVRGVKARYPNTGYLQSENGSGGIKDKTYQQAWLQFKNGEVPNWPDIADGEMNVWGYFNWFNSTIPIKTIDHTTRRIALDRPPMFGMFDPKTVPYGFKQNEYNRFFVQGVKSALDVAGEFYLDGVAGILYYHPRTTPIAAQTIVMPRMKNVIEFKGSSPTNLAENIEFEGIKVNSSDFSNLFDPWEDPLNPRASGPTATGAYKLNVEPTANRHANIYLTNAKNITLKAMDISNSGYSGVLLDMFCQQIVVFNSQIHDVGYAGVQLMGVNDNLRDPLVNKDNVIQNNHIYNLGQLIGHGAGVQIQASATNFINHNEIHNGNRYGVAIIGSSENSSTVNLASNNLVSFNRIYNLNNDSQDTANIYLYAAGKHNVFDHNIIYESNGLTVNSAIYLDNNSDYVTLSNNIGYNTERISQNGNFPTITMLNNVLSAKPADWAAAGLDAKQMGRIGMTNPIWPKFPKISVAVAKDYRLNAGRSAVGSFTSDGYYEGGKALGNLIPIDTTGVVNAAPQEVYQWARFGPSKYVLPNLIANGTYKIRLHFAELTFTSANQRKFHVAVNGERKLTDFDIFATARGIGKANVQEFAVKADAKGQITVEFSAGSVNSPQINGIEVIAD